MQKIKNFFSSSDSSKNDVTFQAGKQAAATKTYATGQWTQDEHDRFVSALKVYGKDYLSISRIVGTRDVKQIKSHA
jgi:SHAQKYF class myb-like DNA-binding protein